MKTTAENRGIGGWRAPCAPFDYREMEKDACRECEAIRAGLERLQKEKPKTQERELIRRREICILTDMYYEQKSASRLFHDRACQQGEGGYH